MSRIETPRLRPRGRHLMTAPRAQGLLGAGAMLAVIAVLIDEWRHLMPESVAILLFLLAVLLSSTFFGFWTGILSALGAFGIFNFFFVEPHLSFLATRPQDLVTLGAFLLAAGLTGFLAGRLREKVDEAEGRAAVLEVLSGASSDLSSAETEEEVLAAALRHLSELTIGPALALAHDGEKPAFIEAWPAGHRPGASDLQAADQAFSRGRVEFATAQGWSGSRFTFHPVPPGKGARHVLGHVPVAADRRDRAWRELAVSAVLRQTETALDRLALARAAAAERHAAEKQAQRAALLASLSHDLRTPLATILGSVTTLRDLRQTLPPAAQADLLTAIEEEAQRLARYVEKLLQMTRIVAGVHAQLHWVDPDEAAQAAVSRARRAFPQATIAVGMPDLPLVRAEAGLLEQALFSLLENAVRYAPGPILMTGSVEADTVVLTVTDAGPGLPAGTAEWLAAPELTGAPGGGLGLPICKGIARTLGGGLSAVPAPGGGTMISIALPIPPEAAP